MEITNTLTNPDVLEKARELLNLEYRMQQASECACNNIFATPYYMRIHDKALADSKQIKNELTAMGYSISITNGRTKPGYGQNIIVEVERLDEHYVASLFDENELEALEIREQQKG